MKRERLLVLFLLPVLFATGCASTKTVTDRKESPIRLLRSSIPNGGGSSDVLGYAEDKALTPDRYERLDDGARVSGSSAFHFSMSAVEILFDSTWSETLGASIENTMTNAMLSAFAQCSQADALVDVQFDTTFTTDSYWYLPVVNLFLPITQDGIVVASGIPVRCLDAPAPPFPGDEDPRPVSSDNPGSKSAPGSDEIELSETPELVL